MSSMRDVGRRDRGRDILNTPARVARKREERRQMLIKAGLIAALCAGIIGAISWGLHRPQIRIQDVTILGTQVLRADEVATFAKEKLAGKYLFLFPKNSALLYSDRALATALTTHFTRIATVHAELDGLTALRVTITERTPVALWCGEVYEPIAEMRECFFLDVQGLVFASAPQFSGNAYVAFYGPLEDTPLSRTEKSSLPLGQKFLTTQEFTTLTKFVATMGTTLSPVEALTIDLTSRTATLSQGAEVRFSDGQDLNRLTVNLTAAVEAKRKEGKHDLSTDLVYVDLRLADSSDRVYFKFR